MTSHFWKEKAGNNCRWDRAAFTLVELLVVISIIGILAGLLLPALARSKAKAQRIACVNNFKQLTLGWMMYVDDNAGNLPQSEIINPNLTEPIWCFGDMKNDNEASDASLIKQGKIFSYVKSVVLYHCPADRSKRNGQPKIRSVSMNYWLNGKKYVNSSESKHRIYRKTSDFIRPTSSSLMVFIDEHEESISDSSFSILPSNSLFPPFANIPATRRHDNSYVLSFADGHADAWKVTDSGTKNWQWNDPNSLPIYPNLPNADWSRLFLACTVTNN